MTHDQSTPERQLYPSGSKRQSARLKMGKFIVAGFTFVAALMLLDQGPGLDAVQILIATAGAIVATIVYGWMHSQRGL